MKRTIDPSPDQTDCFFPYCPFYFDAFFGSDKVLLMADPEIVDYARLLAHEWKYGHVLNDISAIAKICLRDLATMKQHWKMISRCFFPKEGDASKLINPRMELERAKSMEAKRKRTEAARLGGLAKGRKHGRNADGVLMAERKQSKGRAKVVPEAAHRQGIALPRASTSTSLSSSGSVQEGKEGCGKPSGGEEAGRRAAAPPGPARGDPRFGPEVGVILEHYGISVGHDSSRTDARLWIARRLGLLRAPRGQEVPRFTSEQLILAIDRYAGDEINAMDSPPEFRYRVRNFFNKKTSRGQGWCENFLADDYQAPEARRQGKGHGQGALVGVVNPPATAPEETVPLPIAQEPTPAVWTAGMEALQGRVDEENCAAWFKPLKFRAVLDHEIHADCGGDFQRRWIQRNFADAVRAAWPDHTLVLHVIPQEDQP